MDITVKSPIQSRTKFKRANSVPKISEVAISDCSESPVKRCDPATTRLVSEGNTEDDRYYLYVPMEYGVYPVDDG